MNPRAFILLALAWAMPAAAEVPGGATDAARAYADAVRRGDDLARLDFMADRARDALVAAIGLEESEFRRRLASGELALGARDLVLSPGAATAGRTEAGVEWALVPATVKSTRQDGAEVRIDAAILAFLEEGEWAVLDLTEGTAREGLVRTYPGLAGVPFPELRHEVGR